MELTAILGVISGIAQIASHASATMADVQDAYNAIKGVVGKNPADVSKADLDAIEAKTVELEQRILRPLGPAGADEDE